MPLMAMRWQPAFLRGQFSMSGQMSAGDTLVPSLLLLAYAAATTKRATAEFSVVRAEGQELNFISLWGLSHIRSRNPRTQFAQLLPASVVSVFRNQNS